MSSKGLDFLATTIAAGFRGVCAELRAQRAASAAEHEQTRRGLLEYLGSLEDRDKRYALEHADFKERLRDLEGKAAQ